MSGSLSGAINGGGYTLTKKGANLIAVRAPATDINYLVESGILRAENSNLALGSTGVSVNNGAALEHWATLTFDVPVTLNAGSILRSPNGTGIWNNVTIAGSAAFDASSGSNLVLTGFSGSADMAVTGAGTVALGPNAGAGFTGKWLVSSTSAGLFRVASDTSLGPVPGSPVADAIQLSNGARLQGSVYTGATAAGTDLVLAANRGIFLPVAGQNGGFHTWTGFTTTVGGAVTGPGNLRVTDGGTTVLAGTVNIGGNISKAEAGTATFGAEVTLGGLVDANAGVINFNANLTTVGPVQLGSGIVANLNSPVWSSSSTANGGLRGWTGTTNINVGVATLGDIQLGETTGQGHTVNHLAGDVEVLADVRIGHWSAQNSYYNMQGGSLTLSGTVTDPDDETQGMMFLGIDGTGIFTQTGGVVTVPGVTIDGRTPTEGTDRLAITGGVFKVGEWGLRSGNNNAAASYLIQLGSGTLSATANWSSSLAITLTGSGGDATIDTAAQNITLTGGISGPGGLVKNGAGTLALSGANTYAGATQVNAGRLLVANTSGSGTGTAAVTVETSAALAGSGTIAGATTVDGTLQPGNNNVATLSFGSSLTLAATSTYEVQIAGASSFDRVNVSGAASVNGTIAVSLSYAPVAGATFQIVNAGSISGSPVFDFSAAALANGLFWDTSTFATTGEIKVMSLSSPYELWADDKGVTGGAFDDDDGDGVSNIMEFATNSHPTNGGSRAKAYSKMHTIGGDQVLTYTIAVRDGAVFAQGNPVTAHQVAEVDGIVYTVQASNDLTTWNTVVVTRLTGTDASSVQNALPLPGLDAGWSWHSFRSDGGATSDTEDFIRLKVTEAP